MKLPATIQALLDAPVETSPEPTLYPSSDGKPMADNSRQLMWIMLLYANLCWLFRQRQDVAVHGNMNWYAEQGNPRACQAPDVFVVFGRPPGERESYRQWEEGDVPVTVVFEIVSPSNTMEEMDRKQDFYEQHGVEEYYQYNPHSNWLVGFRRQGEVWRRIRDFDSWVSPRLGIRFVWTEKKLEVYTEQGQRFVPAEEVTDQLQLAQQRAEEEAKRAETAEKRAETEAKRAETEAKRAETAEQRAETEAKRAETEAKRAESAEKLAETEAKRAETEAKRAEAAERQMQRMAELGRKVRRGQASAEEIRELEQLEEELGLQG